MIAGRRLIRVSLAGSSALVPLGGAAACSTSSATEEAARDAGYRSSDGTLHLIPEKERDQPVELAGATIRGTTWDSVDDRGEIVAFVGIDYRESSVATGLAQAKTWGFTWPSIYDETGTTAIDMQGMMTAQPSTAVLDREGRIAAVVLGATTESTLMGLVEDTLGESA